MNSLRFILQLNNLPLAKYLLRIGVLSRLYKQMNSSDYNSICRAWVNDFCHERLPILAFIFDTALGGQLPDAYVGKAVKMAIGGCSIVLLKWLHHKKVYFDTASALHQAMSYWEDRLNKPNVGRLIHWLKTQASTSAQHFWVLQSCVRLIWLTHKSRQFMPKAPWNARAYFTHGLHHRQLRLCRLCKAMFTMLYWSMGLNAFSMWT